MKRSTNGILTTHSGGLARSQDLQEMLMARATERLIDDRLFESAVRDGVREAVERQVAAGLSIVNDGEQGKINFAGVYVRDRLGGLTPDDQPAQVHQAAKQFPEWSARDPATLPWRRQTVTSPLSWKNFSEVERDIANMKAAVAATPVQEAFLTSVSPGVVANQTRNQHYPNRETYLHAIGDVMRREYQAVADAGFLLQLDASDLSGSLRTWSPNATLEDVRKEVAENVEAINYATRDISADKMRLHVCWGVGDVPQELNVEMKDIVDLVLTARPHALSIVGANARHEHEWRVWRNTRLPEGKLLIPGVIDNTTNIIEHPDTVADRITRYANVVGRENVIAGVDCGFVAVRPGPPRVDGRVSWAKLKALSDGAAIASKDLWEQA